MLFTNGFRPNIIKALDIYKKRDTLVKGILGWKDVFHLLEDRQSPLRGASGLPLPLLFTVLFSQFCPRCKYLAHRRFPFYVLPFDFTDCITKRIAERCLKTQTKMVDKRI